MLHVRHLLGGGTGRVGVDELMPEFGRLGLHALVWAIRQGLLLSVCAKPTL